MKHTLVAVGAGLACMIFSLATASGQGYGNAIPSGSYTQSCQNIQVRGDHLRAECQAENGQYLETSLRLNACGGGDIANYNGQLVCARSNGYGDGSGYYGHGQPYWTGSLPGGSYQQSCSRIHMRGSTLIAECTNDQNVAVRSYLDLSQCRRTDHIANVNGQLRCWYNPGY